MNWPLWLAFVKSIVTLAIVIDWMHLRWPMWFGLDKDEP